MTSILFVCIGNSCRSQMAEGFARSHGAGVVLPASAGLAPIDRIAPETASVMREKGVDLSDHFTKSFDPVLAASYDLVVNMSGFDLPRVSQATVLQWPVADPFGSPEEVHRRVRDEIEVGILRIVDDLRLKKTLTSETIGQLIAASPSRRLRLWQMFTGRRGPAKLKD